MLISLRLLRVQPEITLLSPCCSVVGNRFRLALAGAHNFPRCCNTMAQTHNPNTEFEDTISSLGKEYATRCEEEGFGGIYGMNNQSWKDDEEEHLGHANANPPPDHEGSNRGIKVKYKKEEDENQKKAAT